MPGRLRGGTLDVTLRTRLHIADRDRLDLKRGTGRLSRVACAMVRIGLDEFHHGRPSPWAASVNMNSRGSAAAVALMRIPPTAANVPQTATSDTRASRAVRSIARTERGIRWSRQTGRRSEVER